MDWCVRTFSVMPLPSPWKHSRIAYWRMRDLTFIVSHLSGPSQDHCQQPAIPQSHEWPGKRQRPQTHVQLRLIVECHWRFCGCFSCSVITAMDNWYQQPSLRTDQLRDVGRPTASKLPTQRHSYSHPIFVLRSFWLNYKRCKFLGWGRGLPALTWILCSLLWSGTVQTPVMEGPIESYKLKEESVLPKRKGYQADKTLHIPYHSPMATQNSCTCHFTLSKTIFLRTWTTAAHSSLFWKESAQR